MCLLKQMQLWLKTLCHTNDSFVYKGETHMEQITAVNMTVQLGRTFKDAMKGHNLMVCVFRNRAELK